MHIQNGLRVFLKQQQCECITWFGQLTHVLPTCSSRLWNCKSETRMVLWCQGNKSGRVFLFSMLRINYKREKMKRPYLRASYEIRFHLQKLTLGAMGTLHKQIDCGELPYISMRMSKRRGGGGGTGRGSKLPRVLLIKLCYFQLERIHWKLPWSGWHGFSLSWNL